ncbi:hypothetical protein [Actinophytocola sp.]|uniref:hypothetical protein n=1 Tax=Actinophytocola sp. TaxID=1872138 RepID=UPI003D6C6439
MFTLDAGDRVVRPLHTLPVISLLGVLCLLVALFAALALLGWGTLGATRRR